MKPAKGSSAKEVDGNKKAPAKTKPPKSGARKSTTKGDKKPPSKPKGASKKAPKKNTRRMQIKKKAVVGLTDSEIQVAEEKARAIIIEGHRLVSIGNYSEVSSLLENFPSVGASQKQLASYHLLSALAASSGNEQRKFAILTIQCNNDSANPFLHCLLGLEFVRGGDIKNAQKCLAIAQKLNPEIGLVKKLEKWIGRFKLSQKISREEMAGFKRLQLVIVEHKKKREYNKALKACIQAGTILPKANLDLAENLFSILGKLKGEGLKYGRLLAKSYVNELKLTDCLILENKFAKKGNPAMIAFLKERIKSLE